MIELSGEGKLLAKIFFCPFGKHRYYFEITAKKQKVYCVNCDIWLEVDLSYDMVTGKTTIVSQKKIG